jgi:hypothetical protein
MAAPEFHLIGRQLWRNESSSLDRLADVEHAAQDEIRLPPKVDLRCEEAGADEPERG